ncbi:MAG: XkdX family protein [Lachnospiraceae bacterium]|nr:XkdX family protein [Lachnospiraceae bacterium]
MAKIWRNRIIGETQLFENCPARYKTAVLELLKKDVADGTITAEQYEQYTGLTYEAA